MKIALGEFTPSLAITCLRPAVPEAEKVAENPPAAFEVTVEGFVITGFPSKLIVMGELENKVRPCHRDRISNLTAGWSYSYAGRCDNEIGGSIIELAVYDCNCVVTWYRSLWDSEVSVRWDIA